MPRSSSRAASLRLAAAAAAVWLLTLAPAAAEPAAASLSPAQSPGVAVPESQIDDAIAALDALAVELLRRSGIPGLAVAVARDGETVYAKGFGVRKVGEEAEIDADTVFQLASVSKSIGATVVAHQVAAGIVAWDTAVSQVLPWFALSDAWVGQAVTIGDLYAHRSGLPDHAGDHLEDLGYEREEILQRLRFLPLHPFRSYYAYTNFGLTAAAEAVAVASGTDWASLSQAVLYEPLGMDSTSSRFADFERRDNRAVGHVSGPDGYVALYQRQPDAQSPAGGVSASVNDVAKWMTMVLQEGAYEGSQVVASEALLPALSAQAIASPTHAVDARPSLYGYGFNVSVQPSGRVTLGHSGGFALGAGTTYLLIPSLGIGIAVLSNASPVGVAEALAMEFADLVQYGEITRDWLPGYEALMAPITSPFGSLVGEMPPAQAEPPGDLSDYTGRYDNEYYGPLQIDLRGGQLWLALGPAGQEYPLQHWDGDVFTFEPSGENAPAGSISQVAFERADASLAEGVTIEFLDGNGLGTFRR